MKKVILWIAICSGISIQATAQYEPGDIAIIRYNTDSPDGFSFVALTSIAAGDSIYFTDEGWDDTVGLTGWRVSSEEHLKYISPGLNAGDVVHIEESSSDVFTVTGEGGSTVLARGSGFSLFSGDQILAYDGLDGVRPVSPVFLSAITGDDGSGSASGNNDPETKWTKNGEISGSTERSTLPDALVNAVTAISVFGTEHTELDNMIYDCSVTSGNRSELLIAVNNSSNWTKDDDVHQPVSSTCTFTVSTNASTVIHGNEGWRSLSLPVSGGSVTDVSDNSPVQGISGGDDETAAPSLYYNPGSNGSAGNGYTVPADVSTGWGDGLGFIMYFFDNTVNGSSGLPVVLDAAGAEPDTDVTVPLTGTWTMAGNPFQSTIELDAITGNGSSGVNNGLTSPVSVWSDSAGSWRTLNFGEGAEIDDWTGFFIERDDATSLTIPLSAKTDSTYHITHSKSKPVYRSIDLTVSGEGFQDTSTRLYFSPSASAGKDGYDGSKLRPLNNGPFIAFLSDLGDGPETLVQDARPFELTENETYELDFNDVGMSGRFTIKWPNWINIPDFWQVKLTDRVTGTYVNMNTESSYSFRVVSQQKRPVSTNLTPPEMYAKASSLSPRFMINIDHDPLSVSNEYELYGDTFELDQNYPNPFNPTTTISYTLNETGPVRLQVFDLMGKKVAELVNMTKSAGRYSESWDATHMSSGIYIYRLTLAGQTLTRKMTLIK